MAKKIPLRQCLGCREMIAKQDMIRIIKSPEGTFSLDDTGRKNGRGAYVCRSGECLQKAIKSKGLERSFQTTVPDEVYEVLKEELARLESK